MPQVETRRTACDFALSFGWDLVAPRRRASKNRSVRASWTVVGPLVGLDGRWFATLLYRSLVLGNNICEPPFDRISMFCVRSMTIIQIN